jgi:hypothetical protein
MSNTNIFKPYRFTLPLMFVGMLVWVFLFEDIDLAKAGENNSIPHLRKQGSATHLIVDDKPFLILGGELGNSSASDLEYMKPIWPRLVTMNLNTVLVPVYWELIEPEEGQFDFALVDSLIRDARHYNLRLVLLWFASWKNSMSCYAPYWVKTNLERFPRAQDKEGKGMEIISAFSNENRDADARAFSTLMRHIREVDGQAHTVIMIQVENELGMIPDSRDRSAEANQAFRQQVPKELMDYLQQHRATLIPEFLMVWKKAGFKTSGTWEQVFGKGLGTDEIFMAWHYARYINSIVEAGKAEYPLPMFVNAALIRLNYQPGQYPSAGPLPHIMDIWRAGALQIDFLAPDIYFPNFEEWCQKYHRSGNPLFIPEALRGSQAAANVLYAIGQHDAIGFCPFSIESTDDPENHRLTKSYEMLSQLAPLILDNQGKGTMAGIVMDKDDPQQQIKLGDYLLNVSDERNWRWGTKTPEAQATRVGGIIISIGPDEYVVAGSGLIITFEPNSPGDPISGIASIDEGKYVNGRWIPGRRLNGDQSHQGRHLHLPFDSFSIRCIKLYRYR